jgi:hypothetical protein
VAASPDVAPAPVVPAPVAPAPVAPAPVVPVQPDEADAEDDDVGAEEDEAVEQTHQAEFDELAALIAAASAAAGNTDDAYEDDGVVTYDVDVDDMPDDVPYIELRADPAFGRGAAERDDILPADEDDDD